jgi:hypothetical protein
MHGLLSASATTPATLALITAVGPPDWATKQFPSSSSDMTKFIDEKGTFFQRTEVNWQSQKFYNP